MTKYGRFGLGGLGGLLPLIVSLIAVDIAAFSFLDQGTGVPTGVIVGYCVRVAALFLLGGIIAALNKDIENPLSLVQIGIAAPALVTSYLSGAAIINTVQPVNSQTSNLFLASAAAASNSVPELRLAGGLFGDVFKGLQPGLGIELDKPHLDVLPSPPPPPPQLNFDLSSPLRVYNPMTKFCLVIPPAIENSRETLVATFPPDHFMIDNGTCP